MAPDSYFVYRPLLGDRRGALVPAAAAGRGRRSNAARGDRHARRRRSGMSRTRPTARSCRSTCCCWPSAPFRRLRCPARCASEARETRPSSSRCSRTRSRARSGSFVFAVPSGAAGRCRSTSSHCSRGRGSSTRARSASGSPSSRPRTRRSSCSADGELGDRGAAQGPRDRAHRRHDPARVRRRRRWRSRPAARSAPTARWRCHDSKARGCAGSSRDAQGFLPTDPFGQVDGEIDVWAAGDATSFPLKQGGIAAQQADAAAESIAARAGAELEPSPFRPVLRGLLLTGMSPRFLRAEGSPAALARRHRAALVAARQDRRPLPGALPRRAPRTLRAAAGRGARVGGAGRDRARPGRARTGREV